MVERWDRGGGWFSLRSESGSGGDDGTPNVGSDQARWGAAVLKTTPKGVERLRLRVGRRTPKKRQRRNALLKRQTAPPLGRAANARARAPAPRHRREKRERGTRQKPLFSPHSTTPSSSAGGMMTRPFKIAPDLIPPRDECAGDGGRGGASGGGGGAGCDDRLPPPPFRVLSPSPQNLLRSAVYNAITPTKAIALVLLHHTTTKA
jgi:hypothetical protein